MKYALRVTSLSALLLVPAVAVPASAATAASSRPDHVVVVVLENKPFDKIVGASRAPYINGLANGGADFTDSHAVAHPSQPNYLALFSGSTQGVTNDACPREFHGVPNLASELAAAGDTFTGFAEGLPFAGYQGCAYGRYARKHNPWVDFDNVPAASNQPFSAFPSDYSRLPTVAFVVPNLCDDMHDCPVSTGDAWLHAHLNGYLRWAAGHNSLLVLTFDEDDRSSGNHIATIVTGAGIRAGDYSEPIDTYSVLRSIENWYGLSPLGQAVRRDSVGPALALAG